MEASRGSKIELNTHIKLVLFYIDAIEIKLEKWYMIVAMLILKTKRIVKETLMYPIY